MALPESARDLPDQVTSVGNELADISTAIEALPPTPVEADLPDIVQIVADLTATTSSLQAICTTVATILSTTRINQ